MDQLVELTPAECRDLLETDRVGRIAFVTPTGPRIVPVNYALRGDEVRARTTARSELSTYAPGTVVAFEVDHFDNERRRGWSVEAVGPCVREEDPDELLHPVPDQDPQPWAGGRRPVLLRIAWRELSGRRVGGEHWPHPVVSGRGRPY